MRDSSEQSTAKNDDIDIRASVWFTVFLPAALSSEARLRRRPMFLLSDALSEGSTSTYGSRGGCCGEKTGPRGRVCLGPLRTFLSFACCCAAEASADEASLQSIQVCRHHLYTKLHSPSSKACGVSGEDILILRSHLYQDSPNAILSWLSSPDTPQAFDLAASCPGKSLRPMTSRKRRRQRRGRKWERRKVPRHSHFVGDRG